MFLLNLALYIFMFAMVFYLAHRALWLVFFLFNFRFWEILMGQFANGLMDSLLPIQKFLILLALSFITYLTIYFTTIRLPLIRYIFLGVMFIIAVRYYSFSEILFFKDYLQESGMWSIDFWIKQIRAVFSIGADDMLSAFDKVFGVFIDLFVKIVEFIRTA